VLFPNPQLSGSLVDPSMQLFDKEVAGNAQLVKSALICESALLPGLVHNCESAIIIASLSAFEACSVLAKSSDPRRVTCLTHVSAQTGFDSAAVRSQSVLEFCTIELQITVF